MRISGRTRIAGVIGWPVAHSRSPLIHGHWLETHGIDGAYLAFPVEPGRLAAALSGLAALGLAGVNVTVPHKEAAFALIDEADESATRLGAVNTVFVGKDGRLKGANTDGFGFIENLRAGAPGLKPDDGPAVVLGAGGAARAAVGALKDAGWREIRVANRGRARAEALAAHYGEGVAAISWEARAEALSGAGLLVNATTLGMIGQPPLEIDLRALPGRAVVTDVVYAPLETPLLAAAMARGLATVDGIGMLLHQARPGFAGWFGVEPTVTDALRSLVVEDIRKGA